MEVTIDEQKTFIREITLSYPDEDKEIDLIIHQLGVGEEGCVVWDAALVLLNYLFTTKGQKSVKNKNVIELGSGTGVVVLYSYEHKTDEDSDNKFKRSTIVLHKLLIPSS